MRVCSITECNKPYYAKGWCGMHYERNRRFGSPFADMAKRNQASLEDRLWRHTQKTGPNDCWICSANGMRSRYAQLQSAGKGSPKVLAHRLSYELAHGPIPEGMMVLHKCDTPRCVNPAHLRLGTHEENMRDMVRKARSATNKFIGEASGKAVLTEDKVRYIRSSPLRNVDLARELGVSVNCVRGVRIGRTWKHVE